MQPALDPTPGLLAFALQPDGRELRVWRRDGTATRDEVVRFSPFLLLADPGLAAGAPGLVELDRLDGDAELQWLARFASWPDALAARDRCRERAGATGTGTRAPFHFCPDPVQHYLLLTGRTSFGGLGFENLRRLAVDLEVITTEGFTFPHPARPGDRIVAIALATPDGDVQVLRGDRLDEKALIQALGAELRKRDPDVIEGHNIFRFDLEYLEARARLHGIDLAWGRDGSPLRGRPARLSIGERTIGYRRYAIAGRHIVDTWILAQLHDIGSRDLPSFGLKDIARHLGLAAEDRTYLDGDRIGAEFRTAPDRLMAYAADDARETLALAARFAPPYFAQAQLVPFDYQATVLRGAAAKIDALMLREYLRRRRAVPCPRPPGAVGGALVAIFHQGVARPVRHVDVTSLYPSLMLAERIAPATDSLGAFLSLLDTLRTRRVQAKQAMAHAVNPVERGELDAEQRSLKLLINAFYGYLAFSGGHWNDYDAADAVTAAGRRIVSAIIERLQALGAVPVEADTDGVYFVPPPAHDPAEDDRLLAAIAAALPAAIPLELDGRYAAMLSYKLKTYALLDEAGRLTLRGSGFRSRGLEPFQRLLIEELARLILQGRGREARSAVDGWLRAFAAHEVPPTLFARTETLQEPLPVYAERVRTGARPPSAAYELALGSDRAWEPGDQIAYYVAGRGVPTSVTERARLIGDWDPSHPDENLVHYQTKVLEIWERLRPFAEREGLWPVSDERPPDGQLSLFP